ncbi:hypothetical protein CWE15_05010 [Aliidiomarina taiwanensis]|uniref:Uncharacterized protein n=1 Tax=Aliidiomarina taiwanensis TaxID=946228 RepID=A0A432X7F3_9GAMM|nr:hypothetical protein [Aliidiomarina taiwanensis]RUO42770.1 hypothetical protein CWE15_05010 [Aliidiomarina taiwanensis]
MRKQHILLIAAVSVAMAGCSSMSKNEKMSAVNAEHYEVDWEYVSMVEKSNRNGAAPARVIWVNPPVKKTEEGR